MNLLLFICTGNYYRSRFAEAVFNHHAKQRGLPWRAFSSGLAIHLAPPGISSHTREALAAREIDEYHTGPERVSLAEPDLAAAHRVIALQDEEHRPMIRTECRSSLPFTRAHRARRSGGPLQVPGRQTHRRRDRRLPQGGRKPRGPAATA